MSAEGAQSPFFILEEFSNFPFTFRGRVPCLTLYYQGEALFFVSREETLYFLHYSRDGFPFFGVVVEGERFSPCYI